ncbi:MAG: hypothetical protein BM485_02020 [Desulfobulbaceae bacterium DB1]|nr:MAG: hypothetical protein BM485_02020 [Desulfobulbaceae bacterium DB1]
MKEYIVRLVPRSAFAPAIHSDTIFGAVCWGIRTLFGLEQLLESLARFREKEPPFLFSSAFPYRETSRGFRYFLPRPILQPIPAARLRGLIPDEKRRIYHSEKYSLVRGAQRYKEFKKIQWIPQDIFQRILHDPREEVLFQAFLDGLYLAPRFQTNAVRQQNSIERLAGSTAGAGNVFHSHEARFRCCHGLYFLLRVADEATDLLLSVLNYLADSGIGADARTGKNWFTVELEGKRMFETVTGGDGFFTLSRYIPQESLADSKSWYAIAPVRSTVESRLEFAGDDIWKRRVMYLMPGSYISPMTRQAHFGGIVPVKELAGQTIYQYGLAYPVWAGKGGAPCNTN